MLFSKMRLIILILVLVVGQLVLKAQSLPEWYRVYTFEDSVIEVNTSIVTLISDDVRRVRFRWRFDEPQSLDGLPGLRYQSRLEVIELNCKMDRYRYYHTTFYDAAGNMVRIEDRSGDWRRAGTFMPENILSWACLLTGTKTDRPVINQQEKELEKAAAYSHDVAQLLEHSRDFKPVIERFFITDYLDRYLQDGRHQWLFNVSRNAATKASPNELQRFYIAMMNAAYFSSIYLSSEIPSDYEDEPESVELSIPSDVLDKIRHHPYTAKYKAGTNNYDFLSEPIKSAEQLRSYTALLEEIGTLLKKHATQIGAVNSRRYQSLLEDWDVYEPEITVCAHTCLGLPAGTEIFEVNVPVFHLQLAKFRGNLKVISAKTIF